MSCPHWQPEQHEWTQKTPFKLGT